MELSELFYRGCDDIRDQYIVDHSDRMLAVFDGKEIGGVWSTIQKAETKGVPVLYYPREAL